MSKQRLPNPLSLPRMSPDVSRHLTESHVTLFCVSSFFLSFYFFSLLCLRFRYHQDSFCHSKFLLLYTFTNNGDPARFLFPISLFLRSTLLLQFFAIFQFSFLLSNSTLLLLFFYFLLFFYILLSFFLLVFGFGFVIFFGLSQVPLDPLSFHLLMSLVASFDSTRVYTSLSFSFYFFLSFASSASFESAFPRALFMSFALLHTSFPFSSTSSFTSFYPSFSFPNRYLL